MSKKIQRRNTAQPNAIPADGNKWVIPDNFLLLWSLLLTLAVFFNTLGAGFVNWDDHGYLWLNALIQPLSGGAIADMFTGHTCGNYSPLVVLSYSIEHIFDPVVKPGEMVADNFNPFTYHLTNVLLPWELQQCPFSCSAPWASGVGHLVLLPFCSVFTRCAVKV